MMHRIIPLNTAAADKLLALDNFLALHSLRRIADLVAGGYVVEGPRGVVWLNKSHELTKWLIDIEGTAL